MGRPVLSGVTQPSRATLETHLDLEANYIGGAVRGGVSLAQAEDTCVTLLRESLTASAWGTFLGPLLHEYLHIDAPLPVIACRRGLPFEKTWDETPEFCRRALPVTKEEEELAEPYCRSGDAKGSAVRLDLGIPFRANAWPRASVQVRQWTWGVMGSYAWRTKPSLINRGELLALVNAVKWRLRTRRGLRRRFLHLIDSQVVLSVVVLGRSSSRRLQGPLKTLGSLLLATGSIGCYAFVSTHNNPADRPSRWKRWERKRRFLGRKVKVSGK